MNREEYLLKLEEKLLLTKSKAQIITLYLDALEEIERLNNIIDEIEKWLNNQCDFDEYQDINYRETMEYVLGYLKELKEGK